MNIKRSPQDWLIKRDKGAAKWQIGFILETKRAQYYNNFNDWMNTKELVKKIVEYSKNKINESFLPKPWITPIKYLLFSSKINIGQVSLNEKEVYKNEAICQPSPKSKINSQYFYYTAPFFIINNVNKIEIALVSSKEQKYKKLEEYEQSIIFEAVTLGLDKDVLMKDSHLDWIGKIPAHWDLRRVKDISKIKKGKAVETFWEQGSNMLPCIDANFLRGRTNIVYCSSGVKVLPEKVLILWDGANAGELFFNKDVGYLGSTFGVFNTELNNQFLFYYLKAIEQYIRDNLTGMGVPHVDGNVLKQAIVLVPPKEQQISIANYLDIETLKLEKKKEIMKKKIGLLKEYKQTIVYEAVTGKIEIN